MIGWGAVVSSIQFVCQGAHLCLSETGRCQQRHCFPLLTRLDHCSYENRTLPGSPRPALISASLTHVHLRVSDMRIMLRTYRAVAFDPERQREACSTHEAHAPHPWAEGSLGAWFVSPLGELVNDARDAAQSNVFYDVFDRRIFCLCVQVCDHFERLTHEEGAQGKARRCNVPGYVCRRLAQEDGRQGRTAVQLYRITGREREHKYKIFSLHLAIFWFL